MKLAILLMLLPGCALFGPCPVDEPAAELAQDVDDALADGEVDEREMAMLDRSVGEVAEAFEEKRRSRMAPPKTGIPWMDLALGAVVSIAGAHSTVNWSRDRKRKNRGEPVGKAKATA